MADLSDHGKKDEGLPQEEIARFHIKGFGRTRFVGESTDPVTGKKVNVYEVIDEEWGDGDEISSQRGPADVHRWPQP